MLLIYLESEFLSVADLMVDNFIRFGIMVCCYVSARSQNLVRFFSLCWITGSRTIHPPIKGLLSEAGIESTPFWSSAYKVAGLHMHATKPGYLYFKLSKYNFSIYTKVMISGINLSPTRHLSLLSF